MGWDTKKPVVEVRRGRLLRRTAGESCDADRADHGGRRDRLRMRALEAVRLVRMSGQRGPLRFGVQVYTPRGTIETACCSQHIESEEYHDYDELFHNTVCSSFLASLGRLAVVRRIPSPKTWPQRTSHWPRIAMRWHSRPTPGTSG